ncbi:brainiac [Carabus blaptoides fortunei]
MTPRLKLKYLLIAICAFLILKFFGVFTHIFERDFYNDFHYPYDGDVHEFVEQLRHNVKPDVAPINVYNYSFITDCGHKCRSSEGDVLEPRLVYIVKSAIHNGARREAIRQSWGYEHRFSDVTIRTVFLLGVDSDGTSFDTVKSEYNKYGDIVQANFIDSYYNNTIKTMMGFKWAVTHCSQSKFYMFVDDDMYVSTKNVLRFVRNPTNYPAYLQEPVYSLKDKKKMADSRPRDKRQVLDFELPNDVHLYSGYVFISAPHRHKTSKWHVDLDEYPYHMWPPYVTAGSYIVSREALHELYYTSYYTKHFRFDDIYLGLVALKANIEPYHCVEFHFYKKAYSVFGYTYVISSHGYEDPKELLRVWNEQKSAGNA